MEGRAHTTHPCLTQGHTEGGAHSQAPWRLAVGTLPR